MPTDAEHRVIAERFERFARDAEEHYPGWAITALFYAALHLAELYFYLNPAAGEERHITSHAQRLAAIRRHLREIFGSYLALRTASEDHRYRGIVHRPEDVRTARTAWYEPLKTAIEQQIGQP